MRLEPFASFETWAKNVGICALARNIDEDQSEFVLSFSSATADDRYWTTPYDNKQILVFITALLNALAPWEYCWVLKRGGVWDDMGDADGLEPVLRGLGITPGHDGAILFNDSERPALTLLLVAQIAFGWCGYYDVWVVPSHGRQMILTDDDDITGMLFADEAVLNHTVDHLTWLRLGSRCRRHRRVKGSPGSPGWGLDQATRRASCSVKAICRREEADQSRAAATL